MRRALAGLAALLAVAIAGPAARAQPPQGDPAQGQALFQDRCGMCHVLGGQGMGPELTGVVGRKSAIVPGFSYTPALAASGLTWTPDNLDRWLADPRALVPGTAMRIKVLVAGDRRDLIAYLATLRTH